MKGMKPLTMRNRAPYCAPGWECVVIIRMKPIIVVMQLAKMKK